MSFDARGYVSFETALSVWGVLDHLVHVVRIATVAADRVDDVPELGRVEWINLPDDLLFGDCEGTPLDFPGLRIAEPEKAVCDLLWLCESRASPLLSRRYASTSSTATDSSATRHAWVLTSACFLTRQGVAPASAPRSVLLDHATVPAASVLRGGFAGRPGGLACQPTDAPQEASPELELKAFVVAAALGRSSRCSAVWD